ncbi:hypothetical protein APTSU1_001045000 [Apodemus speciosus]|uniref:Uncharacterized protein n=1 Tax=Apodemus speciosus TaxID=105296 RepID=A0ABQ0F7X5_APOSI
MLNAIVTNEMSVLGGCPAQMVSHLGEPGHQHVLDRV